VAVGEQTPALIHHDHLGPQPIRTPQSHYPSGDGHATTDVGCAHLADTFHLYSQTKQAHWNIKGKDFFQLHEMFDELDAELLPHVDTIAERATTLGGTALGTARMAASAS
jgi:DNA-binding ferritin-like protein